jgi:hypothetical protein
VSRPSSQPARALRAPRIGIGIALVLLIPRIVRLWYPEVWVEDDFYLESAYLVSAGMRPYLDFVHPHLPVLEWIAAAYIRLFGASHLSLELLNQAAIYATSLLVLALGLRVANRPVAVASAILYGFASLVFRYHVYERECFVAPLVLLATIAALDDRERWRWRPILAIAGPLALACAIKLTAVIPTAVIAAFLILARRRYAAAAAVAVSVAAALAILSLFCYRRYGFEFFFQTFFFHFMKGRDSRELIALYPASILDILAPLSVLGAIRIFSDGRPEKGRALVIAMAAAAYAFFGLMSPTAWGHNYLEALPFIALVAGIGAIGVLAALRNLTGDESPTRSDWLWTVGGGFAIVAGLLILTPLVNENWLRDSVYGFGFVPREELARVAEAVHDASGPADPVIAPSFVCFEANRIELVRFPETYGVYREAESVYTRDGFTAARDRLGRANFFNLIADTAHFWTDQIQDAVMNRRVKVVVSDSPIQLLPLVLVPPELLAQNGYRPILHTQHYTVWALAPSS